MSRHDEVDLREFAPVELAPGTTIDDEGLQAFCRAHGIRRLQLFGSALRGELRADSDIDLLVEFEPGRTPGLLGIARLELALAEMLDRPVDLRTLADLSRYFRYQVAAEARTLYDAA
jgi:predicted nucleotidyltransferase